MTEDSKPLMAEFQPLKTKILQVAGSNSAASSMLEQLAEDSDEGICVLSINVQLVAQFVVISCSFDVLLFCTVGKRSAESGSKQSGRNTFLPMYFST